MNKYSAYLKPNTTAGEVGFIMQQAGQFFGIGSVTCQAKDYQLSFSKKIG